MLYIYDYKQSLELILQFRYSSSSRIENIPNIFCCCNWFGRCSVLSHRNCLEAPTCYILFCFARCCCCLEVGKQNTFRIEARRNKKNCFRLSAHAHRKSTECHTGRGNNSQESAFAQWKYKLYYKCTLSQIGTDRKSNWIEIKHKLYSLCLYAAQCSYFLSVNSLEYFFLLTAVRYNLQCSKFFAICLF